VKCEEVVSEKFDVRHELGLLRGYPAGEPRTAKLG
jgi:hypothetical protein